ncbi:MAG: hypothetical protein FWG67_01335 [Defluviitaleaceae bacterium]|nr:hypothetical protein [Defluviitaleaceae bacterium]
MVYRWELSSFYAGITFFVTGIYHLLEARDKKRTANILLVICGSVMALSWLVMMLNFDDLGDTFMLTTISPFFFSGLLIIMGIVKLYRAEKEPLLTKRMQNIILAILAIIIVGLCILLILIMSGVL